MDWTECCNKGERCGDIDSSTQRQLPTKYDHQSVVSSLEKLRRLNFELEAKNIHMKKGLISTRDNLNTPSWSPFSVPLPFSSPSANTTSFPKFEEFTASRIRNNGYSKRSPIQVDFTDPSLKSPPQSMSRSSYGPISTPVKKTMSHKSTTQRSNKQQQQIIIDLKTHSQIPKKSLKKSPTVSTDPRILTVQAGAVPYAYLKSGYNRPMSEQTKADTTVSFETR